LRANLELKQLQMEESFQQIKIHQSEYDNCLETLCKQI